jgi:DNA-binding transcriptional regulator YiaG
MEIKEGDTVGTIHVNSSERVCRNCGFAFKGMEAADDEHDAVCRHFGLLTPREIRTIRETHRLTIADLADITSLGEATISRWERGVIMQNRANDNLLRLIQYPENLQRLKNHNQWPVIGKIELAPKTRHIPAAMATFREPKTLGAGAKA